MSHYFQFYLDGTIVENPNDWDKMKVVIERESTFNGLFVNYIDKLTFVGDGYDYILNIIDTNKFCGEIDFAVYEYANGSRVSDGFGYEGIIDVSSAIVNRSECTVKVSVEDRTLGYLFKRYKDLKVQINRTGETINGEALADMLQTFNITVPSPTTIQADYIGNFLSYLVSYITDNRVVFVSDYYQSTNFTLANTVVTFMNLGGGQQATLNWIDMYGQPRSWQSTLGQTASDQANNFTLTQLDQISYADYGQLKYFFYISGSGMVSLHDPQMTGTNVTSIVSTPFVDGGANVAIATGGILNGTNDKYELSLGQIYTAFRKKDDLQCALYVENGVTYFRVEPKVYFLENSAQIFADTLEGVPNIEEAIADDLIFRSLKYSQGYPNDHSTLLQENVAIFSNCAIKDEDINIGLQMGYSAWVNYTELDDADLLLFEDDGALTQVVYDNLVLQAIIFPLHIYIIGLSGNFPLVAKRRLGYVDSSLTIRASEMIVENSFELLRLNRFERPLSCSQLKSMINNPAGHILFYFKPEVTRKGYIRKTETEVLTNNTKFELYSS